MATSSSGGIVLAKAGDLVLTSPAGAITAGTLLSAGALNIAAANLTAGNVSSHDSTVIKAATNVSGQILGARDVLIDGASIKAGAIASGVDFAATKAGAIKLNATGTLTLRHIREQSRPSSCFPPATSPRPRAPSLQAIYGAWQCRTHRRRECIRSGLGAGNVVLSGPSIKAGAVISGVYFAATTASRSDAIVLAGAGH